jgi:hypothetical protein
MQCQYCRTENFDVAKICIACGKPLLASNKTYTKQSHDKRRNRYYVYRRHVDARHPGSYIKHGIRLYLQMPFAALHAGALGNGVASFPHSAPPEQSAYQTQPTESRPHMASALHPPFNPTHACDMPQRPQTTQAPPNSFQFSSAFTERSGSEPSFFTSPEVGGMAYNNMSYGEAALPSKGMVARIMLILSSTAAIAVAGVIGAWWLDNDLVVDMANKVSGWIQPQAQAKTAHSSLKKTTETADGISPEELPYDGLPNTANASNTAFAPQGNSDKRDSVVDGVNSIGATSETQQNKTESGGHGKAAKALSDTASLPPAVTADTVKNGATASNEAAKEVAPVSRPNRTQHKKSSKHKAVSKAERGREINRIQQQADEELKKKAERHKRAIAQEVAKNNSSGSSEHKQYANSAEIVSTRRINMHTLVEKCTSMDNLIDREKCKWRICNGQWGKNGCPSYSTPTPLY